MKKWIFLVAMGLAASSSLQAQQVVERQGFEKKIASVQFVTNSFDFAEVAEEGGPVRNRFEFTNTGEVPIRILDVKASCGCTTPEWSKEEVKPGEKGFVVAEYNPLNRPGVFNKTLTVTTSAEPSVVILNIKGVVKPKPRTAEGDFPAELGNLRMKNRGFAVGRITTEKPTIKKFEIFNQGEKPLSFNKKSVEAPKYITVGFEPQTVPPQGRGTIIVTYDAAAKGELGWSTDSIAFSTNEPGEQSRKVITLSTTVEEYFPPMTEAELAKAPRLQIDRTSHDFHGVAQGTTVETAFTLTNNGRSELLLRNTKSNCGCTISTPEKTSLQPGESIKLTVSFNTEGRRGTQYKTVTVFSNDPTAPTQTISIKARVND